MEQLDKLVSKSKSKLADVSKVLVEYILHAINYITQSQLDLGEEMLSHCQDILISASKQSILVDAEVQALLSHTTSLLLYHKNDLNSSAISLFKSIQQLKLRSIPSKPLHQIMQSRVLCSLHLQLYGLYTSLNNQDLALLHIKEALKKSEEILSKCTSICSEHLHRHKNLFPSLKHPQYNLQDSPHYKLFHQLVLKTLPIFLYVQGKHIEAPRIETSWVPPVTLKDLYKMQSFDFNILYKSPELLEEFQEESVLYKVNIHTCILYLIAETYKRSKAGFYKWIEAANRSARILPREWFICQLLARIGMQSRIKSRSVRNRDSAGFPRKFSFTPDKYQRHY